MSPKTWRPEIALNSITTGSTSRLLLILKSTRVRLKERSSSDVWIILSFSEGLHSARLMSFLKTQRWNRITTDGQSVIQSVLHSLCLSWCRAPAGAHHQNSARACGQFLFCFLWGILSNEPMILSAGLWKLTFILTAHSIQFLLHKERRPCLS
jgi:hypothetical protein